MMQYDIYIWDSDRGFVVSFLFKETLVYMGDFLFRINLQFSCDKIVFVPGRDHFVVV